MYKDLETIRMIAQALAMRNPNLREELLQACEAIWEQMYEVDAGEQPEELKSRARSLANKVSTCHSTESMIVALSENDADRIAEEILEFAAELPDPEKARC